MRGIQLAVGLNLAEKGLSLVWYKGTDRRPLLGADSFWPGLVATAFVIVALLSRVCTPPAKCQAAMLDSMPPCTHGVVRPSRHEGDLDAHLKRQNCSISSLGLCPDQGPADGPDIGILVLSVEQGTQCAPGNPMVVCTAARQALVDWLPSMPDLPVALILLLCCS